jgi:hypothetical protein
VINWWMPVVVSAVLTLVLQRYSTRFVISRRERKQRAAQGGTGWRRAKATAEVAARPHPRHYATHCKAARTGLAPGDTGSALCVMANAPACQLFASDQLDLL